MCLGSCRRRQRQQLLAEQRIGTRQQIFDPPVLDDRPVADLRHRIRRRAHRVHFMGNQDDRQLVLITQPLNGRLAGRLQAGVCFQGERLSPARLQGLLAQLGITAEILDSAPLLREAV